MSVCNNHVPEQFLPSSYSEKIRWGRGSACKLGVKILENFQLIFFELVALQQLFTQLLFFCYLLLIYHLIYDMLIIKEMRKGLHSPITVLLKIVTDEF